jgi:2-methylcitrate dehydratase PrpD
MLWSHWSSAVAQRMEIGMPVEVFQGRLQAVICAQLKSEFIDLRRRLLSAGKLEGNTCTAKTYNCCQNSQKPADSNPMNHVLSKCHRSYFL